MLGVAFLFNAASWLVIELRIPRIGAPYIIRYQWGNPGDLFGTRPMLFLVSAIGLIILLTNAMIVGRITARNRPYAFLVSFMTIVAQGIVFAYALVLAGVNAF